MQSSGRGQQLPAVPQEQQQEQRRHPAASASPTHDQAQLQQALPRQAGLDTEAVGTQAEEIVRLVAAGGQPYCCPPCRLVFGSEHEYLEHQLEAAHVTTCRALFEAYTGHKLEGPGMQIVKVKGSSPSVQLDEAQRRQMAARTTSMDAQPDDTPLRDGNRDRLMGILTDRATRTLEHSLQENNPALHVWLSAYLQQNSIPKDGNWSDVSGENFLRTLLTQPIEQISGSFSDEEPQFANASPIGGDPRLVAQHIMDYRHAIAKEWIEELKLVQEENKLLLSESLMSSLNSSLAAPGSSRNEGAGKQQAPKQPRADSEVDDSAGGSDD
ncbi:hypothetical protein ABPG77_000307 [Micractinium sp. CCAP 211/92]